MNRKFIMVNEFDRQFKKLGLTDEDLRRLQSELSSDPIAGDVMQGTDGVRKYRFAFENKGKSGSSRVIYVDFLACETIVLLTIYAKNEKDNLSKKEQNELKKLTGLLKKSL